MIKVTMPDPVAYLNPRGGVLTRLDTGLERETFTIKLITTTQAEAYADARVREALEEAAQACEARLGQCDDGMSHEDVRDCDEEARQCAAAIRAIKSLH